MGNNTEAAVSHLLPLLLDMAPRILTRDYQEYAVVQGGEIIMNCSVFSSPPPTISW